MKCEDAAGYILKGETDGEGVGDHIAGCDICRGLAETAGLLERRGSDARGRDMSALKVAETGDAVRRILAERKSRAVFGRREPALMLRWAVAAAAAIAAGWFGFYYLGRPDRRPGDGNALPPVRVAAFPAEAVDGAIARLRGRLDRGGNYLTAGTGAGGVFESKAQELMERIRLNAFEIENEIAVSREGVDLLPVLEKTKEETKNDNAIRENSCRGGMAGVCYGLYIPAGFICPGK